MAEIRVLADVRRDEASITDYIDAWIKFYFVKKGEAGEEPPEEPRQKGDDREARAALFDHLYGNLTILDSKAGVLVSSTSIFTAIFGIILASSKALESKDMILLLIIAGGLSLASLLLVLSVVVVHWSTTDELNGATLNTLVRRLVVERNGRTFRYRLSWVLHVVAIIIGFGVVTAHALDVYRAT